MRHVFLVLSLAAALLASAVVGGASRADTFRSGGPNPTWTEMQKFEWYVGYMARAAAMCNAYAEAGVLNDLARMSPYAGIGLAQMRGDSFLGGVCSEIITDAKGLVADAERIQEYIEATYNCAGDGCFGQKLSDWQRHACGNSLKSHFAILAIDDKDIRAVTMINPAKTGSKAAYQARVQFNSCQGSLYIDLTKQCIMEKKRTRGDCEIAGVERY
jgi:hypothetical protein